MDRLHLQDLGHVSLRNNQLTICMPSATQFTDYSLNKIFLIDSHDIQNPVGRRSSCNDCEYLFPHVDGVFYRIPELYLRV